MDNQQPLTRPLKLKALDNHHIWLKFGDGVEGEIDLSPLVERGVFKKLKDHKLFAGVYLSESGAISWGDDIELCPDALYLQLTGKDVIEIMPGLDVISTNA